jgi:hypothetical protein
VAMRISSYALRLERRIRRIDADIAELRKRETEAHDGLTAMLVQRERLAGQLQMHLDHAREQAK